MRCPNCDKTLPRDDARFCSHCGEPVAPSSDQLEAPQSSDDAPISSAPLSKTNQEEPRTQSSVEADSPSSQHPSDNTPLAPQTKTTDVAVKDAADDAEPAEVSSFAAEDTAPSAAFPLEEPSAAGQSDVSDLPEAVQQAAVPLQLPDGTPLPEKREGSPTPRAQVSIPKRPLRDAPAAVSSQTRPPATPRKRMPDAPPTTPDPSTAQSTRGQAEMDHLPTTPLPEPVITDADTRDGRKDRIVQEPTHSLQHTASPAGLHKRTSLALPGKKVTILSLSALVLLLLILWLVIAQPFSVPDVTKPLVSFSDSKLGIAFLYPNGWNDPKIDRNKSTVYVDDSSHTAQVTVSVADATTGDAATYLQRQAAQAGMTKLQTGASLSFAGATWQQIQGTVLQNGATYTSTMLATTHNNHIVMIVQQAPQSVYPQEEDVVFSHIRTSFHFL